MPYSANVLEGVHEACIKRIYEGGTMGDAVTYECFIEFVVRGHHVYKTIWNPVIGEVLVCEQETDNDEDSCAVAVKLDDIIVGHVPQEISRICWYFLERHGAILCEITGHRQYSRDLVQGGLDVPCIFHFWHQEIGTIDKLEILLHRAIGKID